jgi:hypothetical protein
LTAERLRISGYWKRWIYLASIPLGIFFAATLLRLWTRWIRCGFSPDSRVQRAQEQTLEADHPPLAPAQTVDIEPDGGEGAINAADRKGNDLRANLVKATQVLNELDNELVELDFRLVGSSRELAQGLRKTIPEVGRRFIALVQALDKQGLAPDNLRLFGDPTRFRRDAKLGRTEA